MSRNYTVEGGSGYHDDDPHRLFLEKFETLFEVAREATTRAYSYRKKPVRVGTAILSVVDGTTIWGITDGYNTKRDSHQKICGEKKGLRKASLGGYTHAIGMVVVSSTDTDEIEGINGVRTPTLMPCSVCQGDFRADPIARLDMIVVTAGLDHDVVQVNTASRLARITADGDSDLLVHEQTLSGLDFARLVPVYDSMNRDQQFFPKDKRLTSSELVTATILSHRTTIAQ